MAYTFASFQNATSCRKYGPAGAEALLTYLERRYPWQKSMGICACREVFGGGPYSHHAECRAYDMGIPITSSGGPRPEYGNQVLAFLLPHGKRLGIDHAIYNRRIYSGAAPSGRYYSGTHPHYDHIHIGLTRSAGRYLTYATLVSVLGPPEGKIDMPLDANDKKYIEATLRSIIPAEVRKVVVDVLGGDRITMPVVSGDTFKRYGNQGIVNSVWHATGGGKKLFNWLTDIAQVPRQVWSTKPGGQADSDPTAFQWLFRTNGVVTANKVALDELLSRASPADLAAIAKAVNDEADARAAAAEEETPIGGSE